jgi:coronin-1B/1C/6
VSFYFEPRGPAIFPPHNSTTSIMASFAKSRFNHLFATPHKRQFCYESLSVADGSQIRSDGGTSLSANTKFLAYPDKSGGGSTVAVLPLTSYGRRHVPTTSATYQQPLYKIHTSKVHCVSFSPHDQTDTLLASGSSGGAVHIYKVPEEGLVEDQTGSSDQSSIVAMSTESTVHGVVWHPSCSNVLGVQHPKSIEVMDVQAQKSIWSTDAHLQDVHSFAWGWDGKTAVTTSKDKIVRLFDSRTGSISDSTVGHGSWRPSIAAWAGRVDYFYTTGVGSDRSREIKVWDIRNMKKGALVTHRIDSGSSVLIPKVDVDTGLLYVTSRGDTGFRILEWKAGGSKIKEIKHCRLNGDPVLDVCLLPKSSLDVVGCEMARLLRLTQGSIDPVRVELPRKDKSKIDTEIYMDTDARVASMDVASFLAAATGDDVSAPTLVSVVDAVTSLNQGSSKKKKKMTESTTSSTTSSTSTEQESATSTPQGETKGVTTTEEDQAADRRRQKATSAFGGQSKYKYIRCDAPGERNVDKTWYNLKMDTSDTNSMLIAASKEHFVVPWQSKCVVRVD